MKNPRQKAVEIWTAGLDAVRARPLVSSRVRIEDDCLSIEGVEFARADFDRIVVVGAGKAGSEMTLGLADAVGDWLPMTGWVNVPEGTNVDAAGAEIDQAAGVRLFPARPAGVNEPTAAAVQGTKRILEFVQSAGPRDLCIALISGGGSALLPAPLPGISLADKLAVTQWLSGAGADIGELNTVRKHCSTIKGGGLLRACRGGTLVTLVLSDVLGDPLDLIASGPTVPDTSSVEDAIAVLRIYDSQRKLPASVYTVLESSRDEGDTGQGTQTVDAHTIVLGNNAVAVDEAGIRAESLGFNHAMQSARESEGDAAAIGAHIADMVAAMLRADPALHRTDCLITGGEPTVVLAPAGIRGDGGRNQQLVLAAYQRLLELQLTGAEWGRVAVLSGGTDGEDGPTDAAGAFVDSSVHAIATQLGLIPADFLSRNDAYNFFKQVGGLLLTGPTGTNVCDVRVAVVDR